MTRSAVTFAVLTLVVGFAVGVAVGTFLADAPPADGSGVKKSPAGGTAEVPAALPEASPAPGSPPAARARDAAPTPSSSASRPAAPAAGEGRITGRVTGPDGAPLAGALVRATPAEDDEEDAADASTARKDAAGLPGAPPVRDVEAEIRRFAAARRGAAARVREAKTDASGAYELTGLSGKWFRVQAWLAGWRIERTGRNRWDNVEPGATCDFRGAQIRGIRVTVLLPDGTPATEALVEWSPAGEGGGTAGSDTWTAAAPSLEVEPGNYTFTASADLDDETRGGDLLTELRVRAHRALGIAGDEEPAYRSEAVTVKVGAEGPTEATLRLAGRPGILVRAAFPSGQRPPCFRIAATKLDGSAAAEPERLLGDASVRAKWVSGADEGLLPGLEPGTWLAGVTLRGGRVAATTQVTVCTEPVVAALEIAASDWRDWVQVRVLSPDRKPVRDVELWSGCRSSEGEGDAQVDVEPEADGSFRVEHYERGAPHSGGSSSFSGSSLGAGKRTYYVRAKSERWGEVEADYDPAKDREVTLQLFEPALIRVTVTGFAGSPDARRAVLYLETETTRDGHPRFDEQRAEIDATGHASFRPVRPGPCDVILRLAASDTEMDRLNAHWRGAVAARAGLDAVAGTNEVTLAMQPLADLVVSYEGEMPALSRIAADGTLSDRMWTREVKDGRVRFTDLAPGRYRLSAAKGDLRVDVPSAGTVAFRPRPYDSIHLEVEEGSYLRELGLQTGDLVVAIEGAEFRTGDEIDAAIAAAKTRETSRFTILRGAHRFDVTGNGKLFEEDRKSVYRRWTR